MKHYVTFFLLLFAGLIFSYTNLTAQPLIETQSIYGEDDRKEPSEYKKGPIRNAVASVAAIVHQNYITHNPSTNTYELIPHPYDLGLCSEVRYSQQPNASSCTSFLVHPEIVITAGHCLMIRNDCFQYKWVFGYNFKSLRQTQFQLPEKNVYSCKKLLKYHHSYESSDYAIVHLDRPVLDRQPLKYRTEGTINDDDSLVLIGSPLGVPTKITDNGIILKNTDPHIFRVNLDAFNGNSGSPVFNEQTAIVEGILVRGPTDFEMDDVRQCKILKTYSEQELPGEEVMRFTSLLKDLKSSIRRVENSRIKMNDPLIKR